ncbi:hypothetical protein [Nocardia sp. NBC_01327]|uniref:hypothetical protein n=1 Tax=Nocardia sp. NBC_01327 TaxID=2903593 RepID=UPI002E114365|nr:hypothetical protein OG326_23860 [Nocardia sp. NBC_01327]
MILKAVLPAQSAGGGTSVTVAGTYEMEAYNPDTIGAVVIVAPSAVTGVATNNFTVNVRQVRAGTALSTIATQTFALGTNLAAETPFTLTVPTQPLLSAGDVVDVQLVQNGTGLAVPVGVEVEVHIG